MSGQPKDYAPKKGRGPGLQRTISGDPDLQRSVSRLAEYLDGGPNVIQRKALDAFGLLFGPKKAQTEHFVMAAGYAYFESSDTILTSAPYTQVSAQIYFDGRITAGSGAQNAKATSYFGDPCFRSPQPVIVVAPLYLQKATPPRKCLPPYDYTWEISTDIMEAASTSPHRKKRFRYRVYSTGNHEIGVGDYWEIFWMALGYGAGEEGSKIT